MTANALSYKFRRCCQLLSFQIDQFHSSFLSSATAALHVFTVELKAGTDSLAKGGIFGVKDYSRSFRARKKCGLKSKKKISILVLFF
jgi:hypothetical protein